MKISNEVFESIFNDQFKTEFITRTNKNINIPIINERTEERYITALYETVIAVIKKFIVKT